MRAPCARSPAGPGPDGSVILGRSADDEPSFGGRSVRMRERGPLRREDPARCADDGARYGLVRAETLPPRSAIESMSSSLAYFMLWAQAPGSFSTNW